MKAVVFHKPKDMRVEEVPDPKILHPEDVILRVTSTAICGSDLHLYNGFFPQARPMVMGHEFMGVVVETGTGVTTLAEGERVVVPFPIACGSCYFCGHGLPVHCEHSNEKNYGPEGGLVKEKGGALFGYTDLYGGYDGGQAEYVRVPYANFGPRKVREDFSDDQVLFLTDIYPTGYSAVEWAQLQGGETVAVFGCGPVGLMAQKCAWLKGASRVIGIDVESYRMEMARRACNSETIPFDEDTVAKIRDLTGGRGADVCIDAVGMEAERTVLDKAMNVVHAEVGSIKALRAAISAVRRGGTISIVGVYGVSYDNFPLGQIFDKGLTLHTGQALVQRYIDGLIDELEEGKIVLEDIITHHLPLSEAPHGYSIFNEKKDGCVKVVLKP